MNKAKRYPLYYLFPALMIFSVFFIFPTIQGFYYGLTNWNTYRKNIDFVGIQNFVDLFKEGILPLALKNTLIYSVLTTVLLNLVGLALALALNEKIKTGGFFRTIFYVPVVIAPLIVGYIFRAIYNPSTGILNQFLNTFGLGFLAQEWLSNSSVALLAIIGTEIWRSSGYSMIIYLAGIKTISNDLIEQADIDGSSYWQKCKNIIFPMIAPTFTVSLLVTMISSLKVFESVLVLTGGGPGFDTEVLNTFIYRQFASGNWGYASAAGFLQSIVIAIISFVVLKFLRKREVDL